MSTKRATKAAPTTPEIDAIQEAIITAKAIKIGVWNRLQAAVMRGAKTEEIREITDIIDAYDEILVEHGRTLDRLYAAEGHPYSGSAATTGYSMYTYRELEREAIRRYAAGMEVPA